MKFCALRIMCHKVSCIFDFYPIQSQYRIEYFFLFAKISKSNLIHRSYEIIRRSEKKKIEREKDLRENTEVDCCQKKRILLIFKFLHRFFNVHQFAFKMLCRCMFHRHPLLRELRAEKPLKKLFNNSYWVSFCFLWTLLITLNSICRENRWEID